MIALSGKVGASASGLKISACTASLNFETFVSISSAEKLSVHVAAGQQRQRTEAGAAGDKAPARRIGQQLGGVPDQQLLVDAGDQQRAQAAHG